MMSDKKLLVAAEALLELCKSKKLTLATAESCTGGLVAATLSEIPGSSVVLDRGFVTYSNEAKQQMLGVTPGNDRSLWRGEHRMRRGNGQRGVGARLGRSCYLDYRNRRTDGRGPRKAHRACLFLRCVTQRPPHRSRPQIR